MANVRITDLNLIPFSSITVDDVFPIVDVLGDITYKINLNELSQYLSGFNDRWYIESGETITIVKNTQSFIYGDLIVGGELILEDNSKLVVLNGNIIVSGGTISGTGNIISVDLPEFDTKVSGFTYSDNKFTISNNIGSSYSVLVNDFTGLTINGNLSATTISASTIDLCGTNGILFTDTISGCSPINVLSFTNFYEGLSGLTISGGTFYGDGSNLVGSITGGTNLGNGLPIFNSTQNKNLEFNSITGDTLDKISTTLSSNKIQIGINEPNLDIWPLVVKGSKLLNGGVSYISGYTFEVSPLDYIIGETIYSKPSSSTVILNSGDSTYDRIDVIISDVFGNTSVIQGTPSLNPEKPNIDELTQLEITFILVPANSIVPDITTLILYNNNLGTPTEWAFGSVGSQPTRIISSATEETYSGSTSIRVSGVTGAFTTSFRLTGLTTVDTTNYSSLQFAIRNLSANTTTTQIRFRFLTSTGAQNGSAVFMNAAGSSNFVQYNNTNTSSWQIISIPLWRFYLTNNSVQILEVSFNSPNARYYFDLIELLEGYLSSPPVNSWTAIKGDGTTTITAPNPNATLTISGGTNISSSISGSSTVVLNLDNNISLNSVSATTISGGTFYGDGSNLTGIGGGGNFLPLSGGTVTGDTFFNTLSATTISGVTYYGNGSNLTGISGGSTSAFTGNTIVTPTTTNLTFNGTIIKTGTGTTVAGYVYFLNSLNGWQLTNATGTTTSSGLLGIAVGTNPQSDGMMLNGAANFTSFTGTTGTPLYLTTNDGIISEYPPSGFGYVVRIAGYKLNSSGSIYFNPDPTWIQLT
jgi:hypothetical protein